MVKADLVSQNNEYRCKNCKTIFEYGKGWYNAFYCCQMCADEYNRHKKPNINMVDRNNYEG